MLLQIKNLHVSIQGKEIIHGLDLEVNAGEVHAIMGPNGTGKSTLALAIAGKEGYDITEGEIIFEDRVINDMPPEERSRVGIFLGFQYPVEIPGVSLTNFLRTAINEIREYRGQQPMPAGDFLKIMEEKKKLVEIHTKLTSRSVNEGFSGGEKKKNEIFQMAMLEPRLAVLDETDSGLDIDALKIVANGVNLMKRPENATIVITHYQRLLQYIIPDFVHVIYNGRIVKTGGKELAVELEEKGYDWLKSEPQNNLPASK